MIYVCIIHTNIIKIINQGSSVLFSAAGLGDTQSMWDHFSQSQHSIIGAPSMLGIQQMQWIGMRHPHNSLPACFPHRSYLGDTWWGGVASYSHQTTAFQGMPLNKWQLQRLWHTHHSCCHLSAWLLSRTSNSWLPPLSSLVPQSTAGDSVVQCSSCCRKQKLRGVCTDSADGHPVVFPLWRTWTNSPDSTWKLQLCPHTADWSPGTPNCSWRVFCAAASIISSESQPAGDLMMALSAVESFTRPLLTQGFLGCTAVHKDHFFGL